MILSRALETIHKMNTRVLAPLARYVKKGKRKKKREMNSWFKERVAKETGPWNMIVSNRISSNDRVEEEGGHPVPRAPERTSRLQRIHIKPNDLIPQFYHSNSQSEIDFRVPPRLSAVSK